DAVGAEFRTAAGAQLRRVEAVVAQDAMHLVRGVVARPGIVKYHRAAASATQHERRVQARRPGADDHAVPHHDLSPLDGMPLFRRSSPTHSSRAGERPAPVTWRNVT